MNLAKRIRDTVSMEMALGRYCPELKPRGGRVACPIHGGTHPNMSYTDRVFCCHTCGAGGDVIGFVEKLFQMPRERAILKLTSDFAVGAVKGTPSAAKAAEALRMRRIEERKQKLAFHKAQVKKIVETRRALWNLYADDELVFQLDALLDECDQGNDTPDDKLFTEDMTDFCISLLLPYAEQAVEEIKGLNNERQ